VALVPIARSDLLGLAVVVMSLVAGLGLPPVSQTQRLVWAEIAGDDRTTVYSIIGMIQEGSILAGPLLVGVVAGVASASAALIAVALISGFGLAGFRGLASRPVPGKVPGQWVPERKRALRSATPSSRS
jgi:MFS-type transporter involved in bile tolerance (Atg22 family)